MIYILKNELEEQRGMAERGNSMGKGFLMWNPVLGREKHLGEVRVWSLKLDLQHVAHGFC